jgi:ankyrin repeat protein
LYQLIIRFIRFLWVKFQLDELCRAESDDAIKHTLRNLPKDLSETYDRLLGRIVGVQRQDLIKRMFRWIVCARRPLIVDELCEGIAFTINDTRWNQDKIPTDIFRLVTACSNLVIVDEETRVIQFAHYTVQQYILEVQASKEKFFHFDLQVLGEVCVAYLNFSNFETQVTIYVDDNVTAGMAAIERVVATTDMSRPKTGTLDTMSLFSRMVHNKMKPTNIDYSRYIPKKTTPVDHLLDDYRLFGYVRENWLWHTASFPSSDQPKTRRDVLFHNLVLQKQLPFSFRPWQAHTNTKMKCLYLEPVGWALSMDHCALIQTLLKIDPTFVPSAYFEDAGRWFFEDSVNTFISADMLERLEYCAEDTWDAKSIPAQGWLYSRMLNACRRGNLDILQICIPGLLKPPNRSSVKSDYPWFQIEGHLMLEEAGNNQLDIVQTLFYMFNSMDYKSFTTIHDGHVYNALELAVLGGHVEIVRALHRFGWRPQTLLGSGAADGISRLDQAAKQGNDQLVTALLEGLKVEWIDLCYDQLEIAKVNAFISAASAGHESVVRACCQFGLDPLKSNPQGMCAYMRAIRNGRYKIVEHLLCPDSDTGSGFHANVEGLPLSLAASNGHLSIAELLLKYGADPFSASSTFEDLVFQPPSSTEFQMSPTPLYAASANGQNPMVEFLLAKGADPDCLSPTGVLSTNQKVENCKRSDFTRRLIFYSDKRAYEIRDIISKNDVDYFQRPLTGAAVNGQFEIVKTLLRTKADINAKDPNGDTALFLAASLGYTEIVHALLEAGATPKEATESGRAGWQLLMCAADPKRVVCVKCLLELGVHPAPMNKDGQSPLHLAVITGSPAAAKLLLEAGAMTECRDSKRNTPLVAACLSGNVEAASILIEAGANINAENAQRQSVLVQSCRKASSEIVELLIAGGAVINSADARGCTPLFASCERGDQRIVDLLLEKGAEVDCRLLDIETYGTLDRFEMGLWHERTTPLMVAAARGSSYIVSSLIQAGADKEAIDINRRTALMHAALKGRASTVMLLIKSGASITR